MIESERFIRWLKVILLLVFGSTGSLVTAQPTSEEVDQLAAAVEQKVIEWRRDLHRFPELSNREFKTAEKIASHLQSLGMELQTEVAHTGVVAILRGGKPGPVVGLRADMDALPVTERTDVPFKSMVTATYNGVETGVMHACGHDTHVAVLMGVAEALAGIRDRLPGTVKFIFQPAEEGPPPGEEGGAELMVKQGVLRNPPVEVMFGMHIHANMPVGSIGYKAGGMMAAADRLAITVHGVQTHGSQPWHGVDPITVASQIITGLQHIVSRQIELTKEPAVITIGMIRGGVRNNIIPEKVEMIGTIRTLDTAMQSAIHEKVRLTATRIAESGGARAEVEIVRQVPITYNDPGLMEKMIPSLVKSTTDLRLIDATTGAEDFSFYAREVPSLFFRVGGCPPDQDPDKAPAHHTPDFFIDESGLIVGIKAFLYLTLDYMHEE